MQAATEGDIEAVKKYLESGGDPALECFDPKGNMIFGEERYLNQGIIASRSKPLFEYYLSYELPQDIKDLLILAALDEKDLDQIRLAVNRGGHAFWNANDCLEYYASGAIEDYDLLHEAGYDFNWQNEDGNTLLMVHAKCRADETSDELISILQFLIDHGARTDIKNEDGRTAYDLAKNPKVKAFLGENGTEK